MSRSDEDDDEVEYDEEDESEEQTAPRQRMRPSELMFGTTGRIALGVLGVLLFLGGVALVSKFVFQEGPKVAGAKKSTSEKGTPSTKPTPVPDGEAKSSEAGTDKRAGNILPTSGTQDLALDPAPDPTAAFSTTFPAAAKQQPRGDDRYSEYYQQDPDGNASPVDTEPVAEPLPDEDAASTTIAPANIAEFDRVPPAVTPVAASPPKPLRQPETVAPIQAKRSYQVREGESLFDIARYELGSAARWIEIYDLNATSLGEQLDALRGGTRLLIPEH